ncbi:MAG TPA: DUF433 domain-containing protein [Candidatus Solibacter sp.]|nr:DUF433 domain-containing protein [Candidatus Solibacter sp.]
MATEYVERRPEGFYIVDSRVPIDRIVHEYWTGEEPETTQLHFPTLTLEQVKGALEFYLSHREEVDRVIEERKRAEEMYIAEHPTPPEIVAKFERMRRQIASRRS